jgi:NAD+ kinase
MAQTASQYVSNQAVTSNGMSSDYINESGKLQDSTPAERSSHEKNTDLLQEGLSSMHSSVDSFDQSTSPNKNNEKTQSNGTLRGIIPIDRDSSQASTTGGERCFPTLSNKTNPLEAQVPPHDIFSKKEMSRFWGSKKVSKPSCSSNLVNRFECLPDPMSMHNRRLQGQEIISSGHNPRPKIVGPEVSSNGSAQIAIGNKW